MHLIIIQYVQNDYYAWQITLGGNVRLKLYEGMYIAIATGFLYKEKYCMAIFHIYIRILYTHTCTHTHTHTHTHIHTDTYV